MSIPWLTSTAVVRSWEHVRENHGCAGVDGVTVERFASHLDGELDALRKRVEEGAYRALPLLWPHHRPEEAECTGHAQAARVQVEMKSGIGDAQLLGRTAAFFEWYWQPLNRLGEGLDLGKTGRESGQQFLGRAAFESDGSGWRMVTITLERDSSRDDS